MCEYIFISGPASGEQSDKIVIQISDAIQDQGKHTCGVYRKLITNVQGVKESQDDVNDLLVKILRWKWDPITTEEDQLQADQAERWAGGKIRHIYQWTLQAKARPIFREN